MPEADDMFDNAGGLAGEERGGPTERPSLARHRSGTIPMSPLDDVSDEASSRLQRRKPSVVGAGL